MMLRNSTLRLLRWQPSSTVHRCFCQEPPSGDEHKNEQKDKASEETKKKSPDSRDEARTKLNDLLTSFSKATPKPTTTLKLARPSLPGQKLKKDKKTKQESKLEKAADDVAKTLGGKQEETKRQLLGMIRPDQTVEPSTSGESEVPLEAATDTIEPKKQMDEETMRKSQKILSETIAGMKVDRSSPMDEKDDFNVEYGNRFSERRFSDSTPRSRLHEFRRPTEGKHREEKAIRFEDAKPLNIYPEEYKFDVTMESQLETWDMLTERDMRLAVTHHPRNAFEEMINWTEKGVLWKFPIDNEIGLEEEKSVSFAEHIFLEKHLEGWCPTKGPVRHFMELVCVGLSKNPYLTVERKKDHIEWYRKYFEEKQDILKDVGAL